MSRPTTSDRVELILSVVPWLADRDGARLSEIAAHFGADPVALFRDLRSLSAGPEPEVGFYIQISIEADDGHDDVVGPDDVDDLDAGWNDPWDVDPSSDPVLTAQVHDYYFRAPPQLDQAEVLSLLVAGAAYRDIPGFEALRPALDKLAAALGPGAARAVQVDLGQSRAETLALAREAVGSRTPLALTYYSSGRDEVSGRTVEPWALRSRGGRWYLSGHCRDTGDLRHFRVDRILEAGRAGDPGSFSVPEVVEEPLTGLAEGGQLVELDMPAEDAWMLGSDPMESRVERDDRVVAVMRSHGEAWLDRLLLTLGPGASAVDLDTGASLAPRRAEAARRVLARYGAVGDNAGSAIRST
jgi:proteasome accessory factor C